MSTSVAVNLGYNERAWAVDVITAINQHAAVHKLEIRRAGGEHTLSRKGENSLFPDVILFGDEGGSRVRHGWEMKFPDTPVDDVETIANAARKARRLGVNSFVIWNVDTAQLHVEIDGEFEVIKTWGPIGAAKRSLVQSLENEWRALLRTILHDLNGFFASGTLKSAPPAFLGDAFFSDFLAEFTGVTASALRAAADANATVEAQFNLWWASSPESSASGKAKPLDHQALAQSVLVGWINRLLFCHYLKGFRAEAAAVDGIVDNLSLGDGLVILDRVSASCDFMQVFKREIGAETIPEEAWTGLKQLNAFLTDLAATAIPQEALRLALEGALAAARRKLRGQYTTPDQLAALVVALGMENREGAFLDPCCGTGTIPKAALIARTTRGQSHAQALSGIWASDRFQFPLQFTTMALAEPQAMGEPLRIFRDDVFALTAGQNIQLANPNDGTPLTVALPKMSTIASNLPFVRFETLVKHDTDLPARFMQRVPGSLPDARSDLFAYIILSLEQLLAEDGRVCVVVSNAWLGTEWGSELRERLAVTFDFDAVVTSGRGRWFDNADVVTNVLSLKLKKPGLPANPTRFVTTLKPIGEWDDAYVRSIAADVLGTTTTTDRPGSHRVRSYPQTQLAKLEKTVIGWPGLFADVSWLTILETQLVRAADHLDIARGERRGWDEMFFPADGHGIEAQYIRPVVITARGLTGLTAKADGEAFCCSLSKAELKKLGHHGALAWIKRFETKKNGTGVPLPDALARAGHHWYEMRDETTADFAMKMNPEDDIATMRLNKRSFVNQRLIRLSVDDGTDVELMHALLNSSIAIFFLESSGFGRGLGALDNTPTKLKSGLKIVDPARLGLSDIEAIKKAFKPLLARPVQRIDREMASADRAALDDVILGAVGHKNLAATVRAAVTELYAIRKAVKT